MPIAETAAIVPIIAIELPVLGIGGWVGVTIGFCAAVGVGCMVGVGVGCCVGIAVGSGCLVGKAEGDAMGETDGSINLLPEAYTTKDLLTVCKIPDASRDVIVIV